MAVSPSGLGTLLALIFIGPIIYLARYLYRKRRGLRDHDDTPSPADTEGAAGGEEEGREELKSSEFLFALVGYAIGIGNVWRFPYVIAQNGGAAALFAYIVCAIFVAWPLFTYELILGQHLRKGFMDAWSTIRPRWRGLGWGQLMFLYITNTYMAVIVAYTLPYIKASCQSPLPWTEVGTVPYFEDVVLGKLPDTDLSKGLDLGGFKGEMLVALSIYWVIIFFSVAFGKKILAKITYVTVITPVILMIVLIIVAAMQPGADVGIAFYIGKFEASKLAEFSTWVTACSQILFSLSPGFGTAITYSSFVSRKEDVYKASMIVCFCNSAFSILGGFAVFSIIGWVAQRTGQSVEETAQAVGPGLAFFVVAEAMGLFGKAQNFMSVIFYMMLFSLGLDSTFAMTESLVNAVEEQLAKRGIRRPLWQLVLVLSVLMYVFGLVFVSRKGFAILDMVDMYVGSVFLLYICLVETFIFNFDYGWRRLTTALKAATFGNKGTPQGRTLFPSWLCRIDFHVTVPLAICVLFFYELVDLARNDYHDYPMSINGWGIFLLCLGVVLSLTTIWKRDATEMPPIDEDPAFQEIVNPEDKVGTKDEKVATVETGRGNGPGEDEFIDNEVGGAGAEPEQPLNAAEQELA